MKKDIIVFLVVVGSIILLAHLPGERVAITELNTELQQQKKEILAKTSTTEEIPLLTEEANTFREWIAIEKIVIAAETTARAQQISELTLFPVDRDSYKTKGTPYIEFHIVPTFANNESQTEKNLKVEKALQELHTYVYKTWSQEYADSIYNEYAKKIQDMTE